MNGGKEEESYILTDKSLNGCIKMPNGSLAFFNKLLLCGTAANVHRNTLQSETQR